MGWIWPGPSEKRLGATTTSLWRLGATTTHRQAVAQIRLDDVVEFFLDIVYRFWVPH